MTRYERQEHPCACFLCKWRVNHVQVTPSCLCSAPLSARIIMQHGKQTTIKCKYASGYCLIYHDCTGKTYD